jgi:hypothetical protein
MHRGPDPASEASVIVKRLLFSIDGEIFGHIGQLASFEWRQPTFFVKAMAYLSPHFEQDVFVSYSHGHPGGEGTLKEWTFELLRKLKGHILDLDIDLEFSDLVIWWDKDLDPTLQLTSELKAKVRSSGILLIVMSPLYLASRWCKDELTWFSEQIQDRLQDPERVFIVRAVRTDESKWPVFLRDERGFMQPGFGFHGTQNVEPYCWGGSTEDINEYMRSLRTLRIILTKRLRDLRDRALRCKRRLAILAALGRFISMRALKMLRSGEKSMPSSAMRGWSLSAT